MKALALVLLLPVSSVWASDRSVCEVLHGQAYYSDDTIRVSNYMRKNSDVVADCAREKTAPVVQEEVVEASQLPKSLPEKVTVPALDINFDLNSSELSAQARTQLKSLGAYLQSSDESIRIEGFTDATGTAEINQRLAKLRALKAKAFLIRQGIPSDRIEIGAVASEAKADAQPDRSQRRISVSYQ